MTRDIVIVEGGVAETITSNSEVLVIDMDEIDAERKNNDHDYYAWSLDSLREWPPGSVRKSVRTKMMTYARRGGFT